MMRRRAIALFGALLVGGYGCDALLVEPAPDEGIAYATFAIQPAGPQASFGDVSAGLGAVMFVRLQFEAGTHVREVTLPYQVQSEAPSLRVVLDPAESLGWVDLTVSLLSPQLETLFRGRTLIYANGLRVSGEIPVEPIATTILASTIPTITSLADTRTLTGQVLFATGHPIVGAPIVWTSSDPTIVEIVNGNEALPRGNGTVQVIGSALGASTPRQLLVRQAAETLIGIGPADTTIVLGETFQARPFGEDVGGFPLLPGAGVIWSAVGAVSVNQQGVVTTLFPGVGTVSAVSGGQSHSAQITVTPP